MFIDANLEGSGGEGGVPGFNQQQPITSGLQEVLFPFPGSITRDESADVTFTPLVRTVANGRIVEGNFSDYPMVRTGDVPKINVHMTGLSGHARFSEIGEPPVGPVGPAIGNAVFHATGRRVRRLPITPDLLL